MSLYGGCLSVRENGGYIVRIACFGVRSIAITILKNLLKHCET